MPNVERALTEMEASSAFTPTGPMSAGGINLVGPDSPGAPLGRKGSGRAPTRPLGPSNAGNASATGGPGARSDLSSTVLGGLSVGGRDRDGGRSPTNPMVRDPTGGAGAGGTSPGGGQTQHEVLQNFFQSLLSSKDRPGSAAAARTGGRLSTGPGGNGSRVSGDDKGVGNGGGNGGGGGGSNRSSMVETVASGNGGGSGSGTEDGA